MKPQAALMGIGFIAIMGIVGTIERQEENYAPLCSDCHNRTMEMKQYFQRAGSPTPQEMAEAVLATQSPRLLAAIAKVETGGNPSIKRGGYKKRHQGAFQVNPKHWGAVPDDATAQALQAEAILKELTASKPIVSALNHYGGDSTDKYAATVLAEMARVP